MNMNIENLLIEFNDSADDSKELLQAMLAVSQKEKYHNCLHDLV